MANTISNMDDTIDSRDVIERIEYLTEEHENWAEEHPEADYMTTDEGQELAALSTLQDEAEDYCPDWTHGAQLIRDSYFEEAMDDLLEEVGDLPRDLPCYLTISIDYVALQQDYTAVDFDGVTYWVR